jgi:hypothetical protein
MDTTRGTESKFWASNFPTATSACRRPTGKRNDCSMYAAIDLYRKLRKLRQRAQSTRGTGCFSVTRYSPPVHIATKFSQTPTRRGRKTTIRYVQVANLCRMDVQGHGPMLEPPASDQDPPAVRHECERQNPARGAAVELPQPFRRKPDQLVFQGGPHPHRTLSGQTHGHHPQLRARAQALVRGFIPVLWQWARSWVGTILWRWACSWGCNGFLL